MEDFTKSTRASAARLMDEAARASRHIDAIVKKSRSSDTMDRPVKFGRLVGKLG